MEALEREFAGVGADRPPGRFVLEPWERTDASGAPGGGGRMAMLRGRLFEKMGVHASVVHGAFQPEFASQIPGADADPRFWAAGVSVIAHPWSPHVPTVHMNTRLVRTTKTWFGGGADLTPMLDERRKPDDPDAIAFHAAMRAACERHPGVADAERYKTGATSISISSIATSRAGSAASSSIISTARATPAIPHSTPISPSCATLARASSAVYSDIVRRNAEKPWSEAERERQLARRGRYVEFNLLYDRGTIFGLKTGGNVASILSSMPPLASWP